MPELYTAAGLLPRARAKRTFLRVDARHSTQARAFRGKKETLVLGTCILRLAKCTFCGPQNATAPREELVPLDKGGRRPATKDESRSGYSCPPPGDITDGGDDERPVHFENGPKCLKFGYPILRGSIRGAPDLRLCGVPYCPYGRMRLKFQTHPPGFEVNGPLAVPAVPGARQGGACQRPNPPSRANRPAQRR